MKFLSLSVFLLFAVALCTCADIGSFETENKNDNPVEKSISDENQESVENSISDETQGPEEPQEPDAIAVEKVSEEEDNDPVFPDEPETEETSDNSEVAEQDTDQALADDESVTAEDVVVRLAPGKKIVLTIGGTCSGRGTGVTYTRWGKKSCRRGAQLVYSGIVGGGHYSQRGNAASYMCLPYTPQYLSYSRAPGGNAGSYIYGAEYQSGNTVFNRNVHDYNVPCAVCFAPRKSTQVVIPARYSCPRYFQREYYGYLMASHHSHAQNVGPACVDVNPDIIGTRRNTDGILFYFMRVICGESFKCGPYITSKAISCAVCTR